MIKLSAILNEIYADTDIVYFYKNDSKIIAKRIPADEVMNDESYLKAVSMKDLKKDPKLKFVADALVDNDDCYLTANESKIVCDELKIQITVEEPVADASNIDTTPITKVKKSTIKDKLANLKSKILSYRIGIGWK